MHLINFAEEFLDIPFLRPYHPQYAQIFLECSLSLRTENCTELSNFALDGLIKILHLSRIQLY